MKILHIITTLQMGGAEKLMVDLLPRMQAKGRTAELLLIDGTRTPFYEQLEQKGVTIHSLAMGGGNVYNPLHIWQLIRFLRKNKYDVVHTHNTASQLFAAIAAKVLCSVVLCTTEHNTSNRRRNLKWYRPIDRWMYRQYKAVICISDQTEENLKNHINDNRVTTRTIYNGIDVSTYANARPNSELSAAKGQKKVIAMVAAFRYQKDQDTLVKAIKLLPNDYELWLIGDGERRSIVETLAETEGVADRVKFLGIRSDVPSVLKVVDVVTHSSHIEGFGLAAVEAMAVGKPVVASDVAGLADIVDGYGILFPHGDAQALTAKVLKLMTDKDYYNNVAAKCSARAADFDISKMVDGYLDVYREITQTSK
jgi:glycosyltransferase involved in cell wall biosynthesis